MLFHQNNPQESQLSFFSLFLNEYLERNKEKYRPIIDEVLKEAHLFSLGQKNAFSLSGRFVLVVFYLDEKDKAYFQALDTSSEFKPEVYQHVKEILA